MFNIKNINLPTHFEKEDTDNLDKDSRFQRVKVYIAHTGENLNNSIFSKEVLEKMSPSLSYIPILGLIGENKNGDKDFRDHASNVVWDKENNDIQVNYKTQAYGFVGKDHNAHFEITGGKEWLVCDGYLWTRFNEALDLFDKANGSKGQSMEILDADGYIDEQGRLVWQNGKFAGLCILGDDVPPAMTGSVISTEFSRNEIKAEIQQMFAEFSSEKGENFLAKKTKKSQDEEVSVESTEKETEIKEEKGSKGSTEAKSTENHESESASQTDDEHEESTSSSSEHDTHESSDNEHAEMSVSDDKKDEDIDVGSEDDNDNSDDKNDNVENSDDDESNENEEDNDKDKKAQFTLTLSEQELAFENAFLSKHCEDYCYYYPVEVFNDYGIICESSSTGKKYFKATYVVNADDSITISDIVEVFLEFLTNDEVQKLENDRLHIAELEQELESLKSYKANVENDKKKAILSQAKEELGEQAYAKISSQFSTLTPEEVEKEVALALYKQDKLQTKSKATVFAQNFKSDLGFGDLDRLFHK